MADTTKPGAMMWAGRTITALVALAMIADGLAGLIRPQLFAPEMAADGWAADRMLTVALCALVGGLLYAIPRTAMLGAILITGFVGGAIATHLRVTLQIIPPEIINVLLGVGAWGGLWLRDARLRALMPLSS